MTDSDKDRAIVPCSSSPCFNSVFLIAPDALGVAKEVMASVADALLDNRHQRAFEAQKGRCRQGNSAGVWCVGLTAQNFLMPAPDLSIAILCVMSGLACSGVLTHTTFALQ